MKGGSQPGGTPPGITIGTVGTLTYDGALLGSYTFNPGPTVDGGSAKLLMIGVWCTGHGFRNNSHNIDPDAFTLNSVSYSSLLFQYLQNTGTNKYVQALAAIWNSPTSGNVVLDLLSNIEATGCGIYYMNLTGLHATPLGVLVRDQVATGTALAFQATTTVSGSLLISVNGCRHEGDTFTFDNTNFVSIGTNYGGVAALDGTFRAGYRNGLATGTYDCGGDWLVGSTERIAGCAFELKAA
jgi:hypothetical protein